MYKTFINTYIDFDNRIGVTLIADEPEEPFGPTTTFLRIYKDTPETVLAERRFYSEDLLPCFKLYLTPISDLSLSFLGIRVEFLLNKDGVVSVGIYTSDYDAVFGLKDVTGTTEVPF